MRTRRPLGTRARERLDAARAATRRPSVGGGDGTNHQGYDGARLDATTALGRTDVEPDFRGTDRDPDIPTAEREAVYERSRGEGDVRRCEATASRRCSGVAVHLHHRKLRRHGDHRAVNLLDVCAQCHHDIHAQPAASYLRGLMVRSADDPATVALTPGVLPVLA
jgi:hypothetical protein